MLALIRAAGVCGPAGVAEPPLPPDPFGGVPAESLALPQPDTIAAASTANAASTVHRLIRPPRGKRARAEAMPDQPRVAPPHKASYAPRAFSIAPAARIRTYVLSFPARGRCPPRDPLPLTPLPQRRGDRAIGRLTRGSADAQPGPRGESAGTRAPRARRPPLVERRGAGGAGPVDAGTGLPAGSPRTGSASRPAGAAEWLEAVLAAIRPIGQPGALDVDAAQAKLGGDRVQHGRSASRVHGIRRVLTAGASRTR